MTQENVVDFVAEDYDIRKVGEALKRENVTLDSLWDLVTTPEVTFPAAPYYLKADDTITRPWDILKMEPVSSVQFGKCTLVTVTAPVSSGETITIIVGMENGDALRGFVVPKNILHRILIDPPRMGGLVALENLSAGSYSLVSLTKTKTTLIRRPGSVCVEEEKSVYNTKGLKC